MKLTPSFALLALGLGKVLAHPLLSTKDDPFAAWAPAGPDDVRAPCPMLNTLANHGFLNHNGKNITFSQLSTAFQTYLSIDPSLSQVLFNDALTTVPTPDATVLDLDDLSRHGILEHDGSLSRKDAYFGDNHDFDADTFAETTAFWGPETITLQQAADARLARMYTSNATNPTFSLSSTGTTFSFGETAAYLLIFNGGGAQGTANRAWVQYLFENERLPTSLGWTTPKGIGSPAVLLNMISQVEAATGGTDPVPSAGKRRSLHAGFGSF